MSDAEIFVGDARVRLAEIESGSVRTCVASPPYFGLRDYGHEDQIGLGDSLDSYVKDLVAVFADVRRVLTDDGTIWLNLGDSYSGSGKGGQSAAKRSEGWQPEYVNKGALYGLPAKNLLGVPWRVAFALQDDGWILRQDIIWAKPNPMPESVTDRCTKSHEYLFLLSKSAKYLFNQLTDPSIYGARGSEFDTGKTGEHQLGRSQPRDRRAGAGRLTYDGKRQGAEGEGQEAFVSISETRNRRDVWTIPTRGFSGAHFAVMPESLVEPCVLAGSNEGNTVLDPFAGSGTVGVVALRHQRNFVGIELNPEYAKMAQQRIEDDAPLLNSVELSPPQRLLDQ